jgi:putative membrane protein
MTKFILRLVINAVALYLAVILLNGRGVEFGGNWVSILWLALIFGLVNAFVRPVLKLLTCPLIILTLGLFTLLINTFLFWLTGRIGQSVGIDITIDGFWPAFLGGLIVSVVSVLLTLILKDELRGRHPESKS